MWKDIRWQIDRLRAVVAYKRREAKRERDRYPTVWKNHLQLVASDLSEIHEHNPGLMDESFLNELVQAREAIISSNAKLSTAVTLLMLFVILTTFDIDMPVTFGGLRVAASPGIPELSVLAIAVLCAAVAGKAVAMSTLLVATKVLVRRIYPDEIYYFKNIQLHQSEAPAFYNPIFGSLAWGKIKLFFVRIQISLMLIVLVSIFAAFLASRGLVYFELWQNPSSDIFWCRLLLVVAFVIDLGWMVFVSLYMVPLPHKDYSRLHALMALQDIVGHEHAAKFMQDEMYGEGSTDLLMMERKGYIKPKTQPDGPSLP